ncbi:ABC transporter ATP-binding protein [Psychrobacillus sp. L4]|uniref:ABC transporter ATP-binding protein n=1 Tax=Psychrobacillus sp. L4 TaxID=3236892 RepID=UPI0036F4442A
MTVLSANNVSYSVKKNKILDSISLTVNEGEILGIVGENGAGKSTLLKILAGIIKPQSGDIKYYDKNLGFLIEDPSLYPYKTGKNHLEYIMKINKWTDYEEYNEITTLLETTEILNKKIKKYSLGMKQKVGILTAVIGNKSLIILDEPTNSLDYNSIPQLRELLYYLKRKGKAIIITSHILTEIERICDRVIILTNGAISDDIRIKDSNQDLEKFVVKKG